MYNGWTAFLKDSKQPGYALSKEWASFGEEDSVYFSMLGRQLAAKPELERRA